MRSAMKLLRHGAALDDIFAATFSWEGLKACKH